MSPKFTIDQMVEVRAVESRTTYGNNVEIGDILRLLRYDPSDDTWKAQFADLRKGLDHYFWIAQSDLNSAVEEKELDAEARALFGIDPCCPTCKRPY